MPANFKSTSDPDAGWACPTVARKGSERAMIDTRPAEHKITIDSYTNRDASPQRARPDESKVFAEMRRLGWITD